jgi:thiol-disulfide isomerase/thioredoxin
MLRISFIVLLSFLLLTSFQERTVKVVDYKGLEPLLSKQNDTVYVVNFWATWCAPCVKEIPYFEKLNETYKDRKVKVLLVSLDFRKNLETALIPFLNRRGIKSEVILLSDPDSNSWISKVDENWTGAIPATLIYHKTKRSFYEKELTYNELDSLLNLKLIDQ